MSMTQVFQVPANVHIATHALNVVGGDSEAFDVPSAFVGHVYVQGSDSPRSKIFAVGTNGNSHFALPAYGFKVVVGSGSAMSAADIQSVGPAGYWRLIGLPASETSVQVVLIGYKSA